MLQDLQKKCGDRKSILHKSSAQEEQSGQAAAEMAITLIFLLVLLGGVMTIGPMVYSHLAVMTAANDCATAASQTLSYEQGLYQGMAAADQSLSGFRIRQGAARVDVASTWERGAPVSCTVAYTVNLNAPFADRFVTDSTIQYTVTMPAQAYKSLWTR